MSSQLIADHSAKTSQLARNFQSKWTPLLAKQIARFQAIVNELVDDPLQQQQQSGAGEPMETEHAGSQEHTSSQERAEGPELSIHAQYILEECLLKIKALLADMLAEHRQVHPPISKCGKDLDRSFQSDLSHLMRNEKDIEANADHRQKANRLIYEHLMSLGRVDVAETFMEESELQLDAHQYDVHSIRQVMDPFRRRQFLPAIEWLEANKPELRDLLFRLHAQHMLQLLEEDKQREALRYGQKLAGFGDRYSEQIAQLMTLVNCYRNKAVVAERYGRFFHEGRWLSLEEDLAAALSDVRSPLSTILNIGAKAIPPLLTLRSLMRRTRHDSALVIDELPCDVPIPQQVHSTFSCPILKVQSTEHNPPLRLSCGHVISSDALGKLAAQGRANRLKCPYCPEESNVQDAVRVYF